MSAPSQKVSMHPLLTSYLKQLSTNPLRTKSTTTAILSFLQEILGSHFANLPINKSATNGPTSILANAHIDARAFKMAIYGAFVSAPLSHFLVGRLQKAFEGRTSGGAKLAMILASNLLIAPVQTVAFLSSMALINGAKSTREVIKTVQAGFFSVIRITWVISPLSLAVAQRFIPQELWVPFFNAIQFVLGTYFNMRMKKLRLAAIKKAQKDKEEEK